MAEAFLALPPGDRREALEVAASVCGRPPHLLEKDVWVVWALETLFRSPLGEHLVFKGGTSLSKAYQAIRRFSEDIDLTYDIRAIAPDLVADSADALPATRSQEKKWSREIRSRLPTWVAEVVMTVIESRLHAEGLDATARADDDTLYIEYPSLAAGTGYIRPAVMLEFGARSTGEPWETRSITCDASAHLPELEFPTAHPRVMRVERTFWEKATAIHVYCLQGRFRSAERFARHWHDIARLGETGHASRALADTAIADAVARHKRLFFPEKDANGQPIDYAAAVTGALCLVPHGEARERLADDYRRMVEDGLLLDEAEPFEVLLARCGEIEAQARAKKAVR
ncbi:nucleotidyl transferase AbiEii/AbiGii toxin family protein [Lamprobacter modestohalophilus]|uniref:nucleotidyl transferase AbiEii/AbiGii toxin family protein n=1 Tax=Lamprobacter modestohalophilus TaxID=1064514 RepID=UPI002ADED6E9|nr:nucleotidyl transferase AbiEii/AbiGii toxin family protein [Lamprobacter modestohalophilus]MEA1053459.1 nucleotidyl transferase AbiEii/AbiGii toxin family protein [Lamprobacter modestohalophilus]